MHNYSGASSYPTNLSLIDDSDAPTAANFNTSIEGLANRTVFLRDALRKWNFHVVSGSESFVVPAGVTELIGVGCGGGGGGGGGQSDQVGAPAQYLCGGGGGGAAQVSWQIVAVTPGETLTCLANVPGSGGVPADFFNPGDGTDGGDSTVKRSGTAIMTFKGGEGGFGARGIATTGQYMYGLGGASVPRGLVNNDLPVISADRFQFRSDTPGTGGCGISNNNVSVRAGMGSLEGRAGGAMGALGADDTTTRGGGAGGGGGASYFSAGGAGGTGGAGHSGAVGGNGTDGGLPTPYQYGGGGGGGGGAGSGNVSGGLGGSGGYGGPGYILLMWTEVGTL